MREYTDAFGNKVDLDDPEIYSYITGDCDSIRDRIHQEIGYFHCYVHYWHIDVDFVSQEERVEDIIERYTSEWRDNMSNLLWHKEILYLIEDEIENMC